MHMHSVDWAIAAVFMVFLIGVAFFCRTYMNSVADFLAAGRCAGRYLISVSSGMAGMGAITIVAMFELYYSAGFTWLWYAFLTMPLLTLAAASGWVSYRFRQTRAMTMAQFFEMRYNKNVRILAGCLAFIAGVVNFGIFPAVTANFFIYFCGLPTDLIFGIDGSTFAVITLLVLAVPLAFIYLGGQIAVMVTEFFQGLFFSIVILLVLIVVVQNFTWDQISQTLLNAPQNASMVNFFHTTGAKHFNPIFYIISAFGIYYGWMAWPSGQAFLCSAKSPHEAKMGRVLGSVRVDIGQTIFFIILPVCILTFLNHPDFAAQAKSVHEELGRIANSQLRIQTTVPVGLAYLLPVGVMGCFCSLMIAAAISSHCTCLHSWGSIFVQDVLLPITGKSLTAQQHIRWLRLSMVFVGVFVFLFSLLFRQVQYILLFCSVTGSIFTSGVGAVIIGGLYWKRGTSTAAIASLIVGSTISIAGLTAIQIKPDFILDGQQVWGIAMAASIAIYVFVSLFSGKPACDLEGILHRDRDAQFEAVSVGKKNIAGFWKLLGLTDEFSTGDKIIYFSLYTWIFGWFALAVVGTVYGLIYGISDRLWLRFWHVYSWIAVAIGVVITVWFMIGGFHNLGELFRELRRKITNDSDDGTVNKQCEHMQPHEAASKCSQD